MAGKQQTIHVTLDAPVYESIRDTFWSVRGGAAYIASVFHMTYRSTLLDMKGLFTQRELLLMLDSLKNVDEFPSHIPPGRFLYDTVRYQIEENRYAIKWDIDPDSFMEKINTRMRMDNSMMCLAIWAWAGTHRNENGRVTYVGQLLK